MFEVRKSEDRGFADHGWLKARHTFSFASYYNPNFMGFRNLLVINQDIVSPSMGFGTHPHKDMEIITYIISGQIRHKDSMGNDYVINSGELQVMSAGTGIRHSEFNASETEHLELLQIWVNTDKSNHTPRYDQFKYSRDEKLNTLKLVIEPITTDQTLPHQKDESTSKSSDAEKTNNSKLHSKTQSKPLGIHQDVLIYASILEPEKELSYNFGDERYGWIQLISGELTLELQDLSKGQTNSITVQAGDGIKIDKSTQIKIQASSESEFLLFDLN